MRSRGWLALLLLSPFAIIILGMQVAASVAVLGGVQAAVGIQTGSSSMLGRGTSMIEGAADLVGRIWRAPTTGALSSNPMTLAAIDDARAAAEAASASADMLRPATDLVVLARGIDGGPPLVSGATINTNRLPEAGAPLSAIDEGLATSAALLAATPGTGPLGAPLGDITRSAQSAMLDMRRYTSAALIALPELPEALGSTEPKRYLICALNDAEIFASGGAPLSVLMVQAARGTISVPISGQLESKLSPANPSITWEHAAGPPWLRDNKRYPFVNSNFHPDFRTAAVDMQRAWAALGYPRVDGVLTVDLNAIRTLLEWTGPVTSEGHGEVGASTLIRKVLIDSYRDFDSREGVLERHARNDAFVEAVGVHASRPWNAIPALRAILRAMPERHIQAAFDADSLEAATGFLDAQGGLAFASADVLGAFSQSGPNKLSIFQERQITQEVTLGPDGGARVKRTIEITNAVPDGVAGRHEDTHGYLALRARMRVAHRLPLGATDLHISTGPTPGLVPVDRTGPFPDDRGGQVMWQGHEAAPGETVTITMDYRLPGGTFTPGRYELWADPQPMTHATRLAVLVTPAPGTSVPPPAGWGIEPDGRLAWRGDLIHQLHLELD